MFCPKCKYEYKEGFLTCSDCGVDLVDELLKEEQCDGNRTGNKLSYILKPEKQSLYISAMIIAIEAVLFLVIVFLENHHLNLPFTDTLLNAIIIANIFLLPIIILVLFLIIRVKQTKYCFLIDFFMTLLILGVVYTIQIYAATYIDYNFLHGTGRRQEFTGGLVLYYGAVFGFIFTVVASALAQVFLVVRYLKLKKELES